MIIQRFKKLLSFLPGGPAYPMSAQEKFTQLIKNISPILKEHGYSKKGTVFRKRQGDNWGMIGILKDKGNTQDRVWFIIEVGIYSLAIDKQLGWGISPPQNLIIHDCHWLKELDGNVTRPGFEWWWDIDQYPSTEALTEVVTERLLNQAIPEIDNHITDEQLKNYWLSGRGSGISEFMKLKQLSILLKLSNEKEKLEKVLREMEAKYGADDEEVLKHTKKMRDETSHKRAKHEATINLKE